MLKRVREWRLPALRRAGAAPQMTEGLFPALLLCSTRGLSNLDPDSQTWRVRSGYHPGAFLAFLKQHASPQCLPLLPFLSLPFCFSLSLCLPLLTMLNGTTFLHVQSLFFFFPRVLYLPSLGENVGSLQAPIHMKKDAQRLVKWSP